jgi:MoxR-like ATPase
MRGVCWNSDTFNHLAVDPERKLLIRALVSGNFKDDLVIDIIEGKVNRFIILLHGGLGTGKTFTAESVAAIARKPLYRVTCGDIGTQP